MSHVLIIDDEPSICWGFREFLREDGHDVGVAASAEEGLRLASERRPDAIVLDIRLPGMDGLTAAREFRARLGHVPIIIITAFGDLDTAVRAVKEGAFDYLPKPFDLDRAADLVSRALEAAQLREQGARAESAATVGETIVGSSPAMQQVFKQIALVAASDVPVLITGESGTGKELVARAIHRNSARQAGPFMPVTLAALSPGVIESELFGHARGAFTGAEGDRRGLLELAAGGSVMLDEIADTPVAVQVKLLRALEQREITPVGEAQPRPIDVRIIAATNRPLPEMIAAGEFREDLFFRLSVFRIHLPPLRARRDDIPSLAAHFLRACSPQTAALGVSEDVLAELSARAWPGNVRELRNAIEHAAILARGNPLRVEHLPPVAPSGEPGAHNPDELAAQISAWTQRKAAAAPADATLYEQFLAATEPSLLREVLDRCGRNRAAAAQLLGMHRTTLRQKLRKYMID